MIVECPHCHDRVLAKPDGTCPACSKSLSDLRGTDPDKVKVTIDDARILPPYCVQCGTSSMRTVSIVEHGYDQSGRETYGEQSRAAFVAFGLFSWIFAGVVWVLSKVFSLGGLGFFGQKRITFILPFCEACARHPTIEVLNVDFERNTLSFLAHRSFRERMYQEAQAD